MNIGKHFTAITIICGLVAIGWGFALAGVRGALTGLVAAFAAGIAFTVAAGSLVVERPEHRREFFRERIGGLAGAIGAGMGVYYGGWRMGWLYGLLGCLFAFPVALIVSILKARKSQQ